MNASLFFYFIFAISILSAESSNWVPVLENGRFRPIGEVQEKLELSEVPVVLEDSTLSIYEKLLRVKGLRIIPSRFPGGVWFSVDTLGVRAANFTPFSDDVYNHLLNTYAEKKSDEILQILEDNYPKLAGKPYLKAAGKSLLYPTIPQLKAEAFYVSFPFIPLAIFFYAVGIIILYFFPAGGRPIIWIAFALHTCILALRCFILGRPPVSNMFETVIYVPWIAVGLSIILDRKGRQPLLLLCGAVSAMLLLLVLKVTGLNETLENVQAVLDSQFWLLIHVLMVVGSYGIFILAGVLGHIELVRDQTKIPVAPLLPLLYLGTVALIGGTILGGIWAAQSWGRFWDWDPKESWAFVSSCIYLLLIHAYRFGKITTRGLAIGSIVGLMAISFTWYGVNYVLGTGLHSYGFGSGGEFWYYGYIGLETLFLLWVVAQKRYSCP